MAKKQNPLLWIAVGLVALVFLGYIQIPDLNLQSIQADTKDQVQPASRQLVSDSIILSATEKYSNSKTQANGGSIELYDKGTNPSDPNAVSLTTLKLGVAYTSSDVLCGKEYRVVYDNATTRYAVDMGDQVLIDCANEYNENTADSFVDMTSKFGLEPTKVATLSDALDETSASGEVNGATSTGTTNTSLTRGVAAMEIGCAGAGGCSADSTLSYNETSGDGTFYLDLTFGATGSQAELKEPVVCFEFDGTNPPEGNEITDLVVQRQSGTDFGIPSSTNWANVFANEECVKLGETISAGVSGKYRFTFTMNEANLNTNDDYTIKFDDLGSYRGKDAKLNLGATHDTVTIDALT